MKKILSIIFFLLTIQCLNAQKAPQAYKGVLDLRSWNFNKGNVKLSGEWEFYWNKLYTPKDFENTVHSPDAYFKVPGSWGGMKIGNKILPDTGYATFRLVLFTNDSILDNFSILVPEILTSYKLWFDNELLVENGKVGTTHQKQKAKVRYTINSIRFDKERNQIIIQIANFQHRSSAFDNAPVLGKTEKIVQAYTKEAAYDFIILGVVLILAIYHFWLFLMRRKNLAALSFAFLSVIIAVRILFTDAYTIEFLFPNISWNLSYTIAYLTFFLMIPIFIVYFKIAFQETKYKWFFYITYGISAIFILTLFLPPIIYTRILFVYQIYTLFTMCFVLYLMIKYIKLGKPGAKTMFVSFMILFLTGINDILYYQDIINTATLLPIGSFVLIVGQSLTLARIFTKAFSDNETLSAKLDYQNQHLQELVDERTKEIELQKQDILQKNEELQVQKEELMAQKDQIVKQNTELEEHNKLITDSINYASTIQKAVLPVGNKIQKYFDNFILFLSRDIVSGDFYWFSEFHNDYLFFALGDCTGHGVPGAFLSLIGVYLLNTIVNEKKITDPRKILEALDEKFNLFLHKSSSKNFDGMDISILRFEKNNLKKINFSAAKSEILIYNQQTKELSRIKGSRRSIGNITDARTKEKIEFRNINLEINPNSTIYLYSDGYIDQNNPSRKRYGTKKFMQYIASIAHMPVQQQKIMLIKEFENFKGTEQQRDDITVIGLKFKKTS
jgi:serine phosphatase RsbU (regulator of sigma subunit)